MRMPKLFIGLISVMFVCGAMGLVTPTDSQAGFFKKKKSFPQAPLIKKFFEKTVCGFRNPKDRFVTSKDGKEVCDRTTGDVWEQDPESLAGRDPMTQPNAIAFCENLGKEKGHGQVYELPSIQQLVSVLDYGEIDPAVDLNVFSNVISNIYWSATLVKDAPSVAWRVIVDAGRVAGDDVGGFALVWCVRRGKDAHADW